MRKDNLAINKHLGISLKEEVVKFIGSAVLTNLATAATTLVASYVGATILSWLPFANLLAGVLIAAMGYVLIYLSAIVYLNILTKVMRVKGSFNLDQSQATKELIADVVSETDVKGIIKEGTQLFKEAYKNGEPVPIVAKHSRRGKNSARSMATNSINYRKNYTHE